MNDHRSAFSSRAALIGAGLLALFGCDEPSPTPTVQPPLAGASIGGPFALTGENGRTVRNSDFDGRYRLIYFGYTYCPDVCPVDMQNLGRGLRLFEAEHAAEAQKVQPIFITVDPERDRPAVLREFTAAFHPRFLGLTGTPEQIASVAREYGVAYQPRRERGAANYLVDHSRVAYLFGPKGEPIALIPQDETPAAVAGALARWVS